MGQKKSAAFQVLLERNVILRYNKDRTTSLVHMGNKVSKCADFQMPDAYRLVRLVSSRELRTSKRMPKKESIFSRLFGIKRQAEAKTIKSTDSLPSTSLGYLQGY